MNERLSGFERFRLAGEGLARFRSDFVPIIESTDLSRTSEVARVIASHHKVAGVYFWTAAVQDAEYKVYAGQTNSLGYRITNYTAPFQPHSPNDFKLLVFRAFLEEVAPSAVLRLYFKELPLAALKLEEKRVIRDYGPLLNVPRAPSPQARRQLEAAFVAYYRSSFEKVLGNGT